MTTVYFCDIFVPKYGFPAIYLLDIYLMAINPDFDDAWPQGGGMNDDDDDMNGMNDGDDDDDLDEDEDDDDSDDDMA